MRQVDFRDESEQLEFAERAARCFAKDGEKQSFSDVKPNPGCFIALRWGMGGDGVLVLKLDTDHIPTNYAQLVKLVETEEFISSLGE